MKLIPGIIFNQNIPGKTGKEQASDKTSNPQINKTQVQQQNIQTSNNKAQPLPGQLTDTPQTNASIIKSVLASLGLPQDNLSSALLAFTRLFSLTPRQEVLANLRREVLQSARNTGDKGLDAKYIEAKALAVLAAFDKGVILEKDALEAYAAYKNEPMEEPKTSNPPYDFYSKSPDAEDLQHSFEKDNEEEDVFGFLNRIAGKNKQRWIVWPFNYTNEGIELKVLLRVLIEEPFYLILDITGPKRIWRFLLNKESENISIDIGIKPGLSSKEIKELKKEIQSLGISDIHIRNDEELPLSQKLGFGDLRSVNKEV